MLSVEGIFQILVYLVITCFLLGGILLKFNIPSVKIMLFGIALIIFSYTFLKGVIIFGIDYIIAVIGLSFCIVGLIKKDNTKLFGSY